MNEEEKKAIEEAEKLLKHDENSLFTDEKMRTLLNLIEKQHKQIEDIKKYANDIILVESKKRNFKCKIRRIYEGLTTQYKMISLARRILKILESE